MFFLFCFFFLFLWLGTFPRVLRPSLLKRAIRIDKNTLFFHFGLLATSSLVQKGKGGNTEHQMSYEHTLNSLLGVCFSEAEQRYSKVNGDKKGQEQQMRHDIICIKQHDPVIKFLVQVQVIICESKVLSKISQHSVKLPFG